jgi:hypothetical protein
MATPLTASALVQALRDEGLTVREYKSWRTHNRNHVGAWGPVNGIMLHHTVTTGTSSSVDLCYRGHSSLPGPLCHGVIDKDGVVHMVGHGRANHAGLGDDDVLEAVIHERALPADNEANVDGNRRFYGFECINLGNGRDEWPAAQVDAMVRVSAALCRAHGWGQRSVIGHLEWQPGKIDPLGPGFPGMSVVRDRVASRLDKPAAPAKPADKPAAPAKSKVARYKVTVNGRTYGYGAYGPHVTAVGQALVSRGHGRYYRTGPGPRWTDADTKNYQLFQRSLGLSGQEADGVPGAWSLSKLLTRSVRTVSLKKLQAAAKSNPPMAGRPVTYEGVRTVEAALVAEGLLAGRYMDGHWGTQTDSAYAKWQRRCGYRGHDADGKPGRASLSKLADKYGFRVSG